MKSNYSKLGNYITESKLKNKDSSETNIVGLSNEKKFIESRANIIGSDLSRYKLILYNQFVYMPTTSRNGDKISIALFKENSGIISSSYIVFDVNTNALNPDYLMLWFKRPEFDRYARYHSHGSVRETFSWEDMKNTNIYVPPLEYQNKVVEIKEEIDNRIAILKNINNNLLKLSEYIYKEFYINTVESYVDKRYITLDEVTSKFATGLNPRKNFVLGEGNNYYVTIKNMAHNSIVLDDKCDSITDEALLKINKRSDLKVGDLLFSGIGTIGRVHLIDKKPTNWNISESIFTLRPNDLVSSEFLFIMLLSREVQEYAKILASGSVQKGIRMRDLKAFEFILPEEEDKIILDSLLTPIIANIKSNEKEIWGLTKLQDTLLPKLMSGEIDVSKINCDLNSNESVTDVI